MVCETCSLNQHTQVRVGLRVYELPYMGTDSRNPAVSVMQFYRSETSIKIYKMEVVCIGDGVLTHTLSV